jgi:hypothetical protein
LGIKKEEVGPKISLLGAAGNSTGNVKVRNI